MSSELVQKTIAKLFLTTHGFERDLIVLLPSLVGRNVVEIGAIFATLLEPLNAANQTILSTISNEQINRERCNGRDPISASYLTDYNSALSRLDHDLQQTNFEIGFTFTITSGRLPSDLHQKLSILLSAGEGARIDLDEVSERPTAPLRSRPSIAK